MKTVGSTLNVEATDSQQIAKNFTAREVSERDLFDLDLNITNSHNSQPPQAFGSERGDGCIINVSRGSNCQYCY